MCAADVYGQPSQKDVGLHIIKQMFVNFISQKLSIGHQSGLNFCLCMIENH